MLELNESSNRKPPGLQLTRRQLTWVLIGVPAFFVFLAYLLSRTGTIRPEPKLDASIRIATEAWSPPKSKPDDVRLYLCADLSNPTQDSWRNVTISLNKQFYYYSHLPLEPNGRLTVPLEHFVTKGGNITFRPGNQTVERLTVFAQLPNGERAVYDEYVKAEDQQ